MHQFTIRAGKSSSDPADVYLYGIFGDAFDGITEKMVAKELKSVGKDSPLVVHINSHGGDAHVGLTIMNLLAAHKGRKDVIVEGLAASAATLPLLAGDSISIHEGAEIMIHNPWVIMAGDYRELATMSMEMEKFTNKMADIYSRKTGNDMATVLNWMNKTTYFDGEDAVRFGFATETLQRSRIAACDEEKATQLWPQLYRDKSRPCGITSGTPHLSAMEMQMQLTRKQ